MGAGRWECERLIQAEQHIADGDRRVVQQIRLVVRLTKQGYNSA